MKLRFNKQSLRLRLSAKDLKTFSEQGELHESLNFDTQNQLSYSLLLNKNCENLMANFEGNHIRIFLPQKVGHDWLCSENISLKHTNDSIKILIEKDLPCDHTGKETSHD